MTALKQMEEIIFSDQTKEANYLQWVNRFDSQLSKLTKAHKEFMQKLSIEETFDKSTLTALNGNPDSWATNIINEAIAKVDEPLKPQYREHFWKAFNEMKPAINDVFSQWESSQYSTSNTIPGELFSLSNLPEIVNGKFDISDKFLNGTKKYFEIKVNTDNKVYDLLNQMKETYKELYSIGRDKGVISAPPEIGRAAGLQNLIEIDFFLTKRADGTITINENTLNKMI